MRVFVGVILWAISLNGAAWMLHVELTWRVLALIAIVNFVTTMVNILVEGKK